MKSSKRQLWEGLAAAAVVALSLGWWGLVQPEVRFRQVIRKYPLGTEAQTVLRDFGGQVILHQSDNFPGPDSTEPEKERWVAYSIDLPEKNARLFFNYHKKLVLAMKYSHFRKPQ